MPGGGQTSSSSNTSSTTQTTQNTATGTVGNVAQISAGATLNSTTTDYGAINGAAAVGQAAIAANSQGLETTLANNTQTIANLFNFVGATEQGASDLISKAIGLAATATGANNEIATTLAGAPPVPGQTLSSISQIDIAKLTPWVVGGVVAYFVFVKGKVKL